MYCPQCGVENEDSARFCRACGRALDKGLQQRQESGSGPAGQPTGQQAPSSEQQYQQPGQPAAHYYQRAPTYGAPPHVPSYMTWAIVTLILCFWPTGIVAVVYASQVGSKLALGDYTGAQESSRKAKIWCWVTFGIAVAGLVIGIIVALLLTAVAVVTF